MGETEANLYKHPNDTATTTSKSRNDNEIAKKEAF